jgi:hypothetical protein
LQLLRRSGYLCDVCERWLPYANVRKDLFGFLDILAISRREPGILGIQVTTGSNLSHRLAKAKSRPELPLWLKVAGFEVWAWQKRSGRWEVRRVAVTREDLAAVVVQPIARRARRVEQRELFA